MPTPPGEPTTSTAGSPAESSPPAAATADNAPTSVVSVPASGDDYVIGEEDEIEISVYGDSDLSKTQVVRPGGYVTFPLIGTIKVAGLTPEVVRQNVTDAVSKYVKAPDVSVIVRGYNNRKLGILGQVKNPGLLRLSTDITLLEGLARAGGLTEDADLAGSMVLRGTQVVPIDFVKLLRYGEAAQNIALRPGDVILVPDVKDKKVFVLGEVGHPQILKLKPGTTLIESVVTAGGFTRDAQKTHVALIRGGLGRPELTTVNVTSITRGTSGAQDVALLPGDIVYVPRTVRSNVIQFFQDVATVLGPFVLAESALTLGPAAYSVLTTGKLGNQSSQSTVVVSPR